MSIRDIATVVNIFTVFSSCIPKITAVSRVPGKVADGPSAGQRINGLRNQSQDTNRTCKEIDEHMALGLKPLPKRAIAHLLVNLVIIIHGQEEQIHWNHRRPPCHEKPIHVAGLDGAQGPHRYAPRGEKRTGEHGKGLQHLPETQACDDATVARRE